MSKLNLKRTVENIRAITTVYSPIFEVVINAIQAIEACARQIPEALHLRAKVSEILGTS